MHGGTLSIIVSELLRLIYLYRRTFDLKRWLFLAFHSALVLLGTIRVGKNNQPATNSISHNIDELRPYPGQAVSILYKLDCGNRIVDRCRYYLEQFNDTLNPQRKSSRED